MSDSARSSVLAEGLADVRLGRARLHVACSGIHPAYAWLLGALLLTPVALGAGASPALVHGLWVWKTPTVLGPPRGAEKLADFSRSEGINEVYVSVSAAVAKSEENQLAHLIALLHRSHIKVEALLSSTDADEPGSHREALLDRVRGIVRFNEMHPMERFDGIHLDVEPQQRPENKGAGNLRFLPGLADAFRAVQAIAKPAGMTVNADIQTKLLKGDLHQRETLLTAVPRLTLMMYEISSPEDGESAAQKADKVERTSQKFLNLAYEGLESQNLATMVVALRTPDYGKLLPQMLKALDDANRTNPRYLGWAWHSYNDAQ